METSSPADIALTLEAEVVPDEVLEAGSAQEAENINDEAKREEALEAASTPATPSDEGVEESAVIQSGATAVDDETHVDDQDEDEPKQPSTNDGANEAEFIVSEVGVEESDGGVASESESDDATRQNSRAAAALGLMPDDFGDEDNEADLVNVVATGNVQQDEGADSSGDEEEEAGLRERESSLTETEIRRLSLKSTGSLAGEKRERAESEVGPWNDPTWLRHRKHVFILSNAGKPIFSRYATVPCEHWV